jgi:hypothetical protein
MSGANIQLQDGRVSKALGWFWGIVGMSITGSILLAANNLYQLNVTVARGLDSDIVRDARIEDHESRLRRVEKDVSTIEGRVFRGIDGYEETPRAK